MKGLYKMGFATAFGTGFFSGLSDTLDKQQASRTKMAEYKKQLELAEPYKVEEEKRRRATLESVERIKREAKRLADTGTNPFTGKTEHPDITAELKGMYTGNTAPDQYSRRLAVLNIMARDGDKYPNFNDAQAEDIISSDPKLFIQINTDREGHKTFTIPFAGRQHLKKRKHLMENLYKKVGHQRMNAATQGEFMGSIDGVSGDILNGSADELFRYYYEKHKGKPFEIFTALTKHIDQFPERATNQGYGRYSVKEREMLTKGREKIEDMDRSTDKVLRLGAAVHALMDAEGYRVSPVSKVLGLTNFIRVEAPAIVGILEGLKGGDDTFEDISELRAQMRSNLVDDYGKSIPSSASSNFDRVMARFDTANKTQVLGIMLAYEIARSREPGGRLNDNDFARAMSTIFSPTEKGTRWNLNTIIKHHAHDKVVAATRLGMPIKLAKRYLDWLQSDPHRLDAYYQAKAKSYRDRASTDAAQVLADEKFTEEDID